MTVDTATGRMTAEEIVALSRKHTLYEWSAQSAVDPIPVERAEGVYFYSPDGTRYLDFNSQLMSVNIGHGDRRVIEAIQRQAEKLAYANPFMAHEPRARLGKKLAELLPGDIDVVFFTNGGAEANENAVKIARMVTGRQKVLSRYRSYHGATGGVIGLTGDPRRWAAEPAVPGIIRAPEYHRWGEPEPRPVGEVLRETEDVIRYEGGQTIAAFILETVVGTNGILIPPDGYLQGIREICDDHGILLIADEVMSGFGRTGAWFAVDHWGVVPDLITLAKGLTSSYLPLGAVGMRQALADHFRNNVFFGGLTYNSHPMGCAAALATIAVYEEDGLIERAKLMGQVMRRHHLELKRKHRSVGAVRNIGLFGIVELVRSREPFEPLAPYNGTSDEMKAVAKHLRDNGLYTFVRWNGIMTNPPLTITDEELAEGFATIDAALEKADQAVHR
ncbi:MAG TPA: aminotransferase class III-fold pyridoxal phosphate-dependent enzyme [Candidatus Limnocylindrales bacterium]|jgi:taurine--2-oxoglutarate transaminase|nr:aminotransferase class III-fold pyridoxal phosphate-dependent enzyme [Candidatus Limnocylindrales bacterium]